MGKTTYEELLNKKQQERQSRLTSASVLLEVVKHLNSDNLVKSLIVAKSALSNAETAEQVSRDSGIPMEELVDTLDRVTLCLRTIT